MTRRYGTVVACCVQCGHRLTATTMDGVLASQWVHADQAACWDAHPAPDTTRPAQAGEVWHGRRRPRVAALGVLAFLAITLALLAYLCVRLVRHKPRRQEKGQEPESATSAVTHPRRQNRLA